MVIIHGQKGTTPEVDRSKGCAESIAANPGVEVVAEQWSNMWSQDEGFQIMQNLLQANPDVSIVFAQADGLALGAAQAIKVGNPSQTIVVGGFDGDTAALEALKNGVFEATATQQTQKMGRLAVDAAVQAGCRRKAGAGSAPRCDADHQGQRRRLHRQPSLIANARRRAMTEPVLSLRGITKRYGPLEVVKNVSLDVYPVKSWRFWAKTARASPLFPASLPDRRPRPKADDMAGAALCPAPPARRSTRAWR